MNSNTNMRESRENVFFFIELFNTAIGAYNIYLASYFFEEYQQICFFVALCVIYFISRVFAFKTFYDESDCDSLAILALDSIYLGCFNYCYYVLTDNNKRVQMMTHATLKLYLSMGLSFIYACCIGVLHNPNYSILLIYGPYCSMLLSIIFAVALIVKYSEGSKCEKIILFINRATPYLTIASLSLFYDYFGINLAYYQLVLCGVALLTVIKYMIDSAYLKNEEKELILFVCVNDFDYDQSQISFIKLRNYFFAMSYICQVIRFSLLSIFAFPNIVHQFKEQKISVSEYAAIINLVITTLFSIGYFIINFRDFAQRLFGYKHFKISTRNGANKLISFLTGRNFFLINLHIKFKFGDYKNKQSNEDIESRLISSDDIIEDIISDTYKALSKFSRKNHNVSIIVSPNSRIEYPESYTSFKKAAEQVDILDYSIYIILENQKYFNYLDITQQRIKNGFTSNDDTLKIIKMNSIKERQILYTQISYILNIFAFNKHLKNLMAFQTSQIEYDLYEI